MSCLEVREQLPEFAIGVLAPADAERIRRHLQWCAGCRKEAGDMEQAAATLAFAVQPAEVPERLGDRVVARVRRAAGTPGTPRRARTAAAALVAAVVAVSSLGWGAVMAGRADRFADRAAQAEREQAAALERFQRVVANVIPGQDLSTNETHLGRLAPVGGSAGGGAVLQLVSPTVLDFVIVIVNGLDEEGLPFRVRLVNEQGVELRAGRITELDVDGGAEVFHQFKARDIGGFTSVNVLDSAGGLLLTGSVDQSA